MRILLMTLCLFTSLVSAEEQAKQLFKELAPSLYQIRLIENASGEKSTIGSGFQINADGLIATNYHVISGFAQFPDKYRLEYLDHEGNKGELKLHRVDVVNDLALVQHSVEDKDDFFAISEVNPDKGDKLFSLGNPHDLGMIVVPGTYNGIKKESFNERIHFTGSVNPGMSGGPVVNDMGMVVGVNVATSGNQIGFLVPQNKLFALINDWQEGPELSVNEQITEQLTANQQRLLSTVLDKEWQPKKLGQAMVPHLDVPWIRCWGESNADKADAPVFTAVASCTLDEDIYISERFFSGSVEMQFRWLQSKKLNEHRFYRQYQKQISSAGPDNKATKSDVTEFSCQHDTVQKSPSGMTTKSILCTRAYKKYPDLYDVLYLGASIDKNTEALISHFTLSGVSKELSLNFTSRFMEAVQWN